MLLKTSSLIILLLLLADKQGEAQNLSEDGLMTALTEKKQIQGGKGYVNTVSPEENTPALISMVNPIVQPRTATAFIQKPAGNLSFTVAALYNYSQQELIYAGEDHTIATGEIIKGMGIDLSAHYQVRKWLHADCNLNLSSEKNISSASAERFSKQPAKITGYAGLSIIPEKGLSGYLRCRLVDGDPVKETSLPALEAYIITDASISGRYKNITLSITINNMLKRNILSPMANTESRLNHGATILNQINYVPATVRQITAGFIYNF